MKTINEALAIINDYENSTSEQLHTAIALILKQKIVDIDEVIFLIDEYNLTSKSRKTEIVWNRYVMMMYLKRKKMKKTEIGKLLNKDDATVICGLQKYRDLMQYSANDFMAVTLNLRLALKMT